LLREITNELYFMCKTIIPVGDKGSTFQSHSYVDQAFYLKNGQLKLIVGKT